MKQSFMDRFFEKRGIFSEMEDLTDKALRQFLRRPGDTGREIGFAIAADEIKTEQVMENVRNKLPVFCHVAELLYAGKEDEAISGETDVILPYISTLREIRERQGLD